MRSQRNDAWALLATGEAAQHAGGLEAIEGRHLEIEHDHIIGFATSRGDSRNAAWYGVGLVPELAQQGDSGELREWLIIDKEESHEADIAQCRKKINLS